MKKIAVILCVLLSLLMIVSCAEPDNKPDAPAVDTDTGTGTGGSSGTGGETVKPDVDTGTSGDSGKPTPGEVELIISMDIFDESIRASIKKIAVLYEVDVAYRAVAKPMIFDVPEDGKVSIGKINVKKGECINYSIKAFDKNSEELAVKIGEIIPDGKSSTIILDASMVIPSKVILMVENPMYESRIASYKWKIDSDVDYKTVGRESEQYTTLGVVDVPPGMDALRVSLTILDVGFDTLGQKNSLVILTPGTKEYVVEGPVEPITRTLEVQKGDYLEEVGGYALFINGSYIKVAAEETGNTVMASSDSYTDGTSYTIRALKKIDDPEKPYDETKVIGESKGFIVIDPDSSRILLETPEPYGCYDISCLPTFSTTNVFWTIAQKNTDESWTEKGGVMRYYPNHPENNRYYLPAGTYKIIKNSINEFAGNPTSWKTQFLSDQEFEIKAKTVTPVFMKFDDYERIDVKVTAKYPSDNLEGWKYHVDMDFGPRKYLGGNHYSYDIEVFSYDNEAKTLTFTCYGIPKDTVSLKITVMEGDQERDSLSYDNTELQTGNLNWNSYKFK